jgi:hypothetical protein
VGAIRDDVRRVGLGRPRAAQEMVVWNLGVGNQFEPRIRFSLFGFHKLRGGGGVKGGRYLDLEGCSSNFVGLVSRQWGY